MRAGRSRAWLFGLLSLMIERSAPYSYRPTLQFGARASTSSSRRQGICSLRAQGSPSTTRQGFLALVLGGLTVSINTGYEPWGIVRAADLLSDEFEVVFDSSAKVGLSLADFGDKGKYRTYVKGVIRGSQAEQQGVKVPALVVAVNGANVEGLPASYVVKLFRQAEGGGELRVKFRDPGRFMELLTDKGATSTAPGSSPGAEGGGSSAPMLAEGQEISTQLAPETKAREAQVLTVKKVEIPEICGYGAKYGDLMEIQYTMTLDDGSLLDATGVSNRGGDSTLYFVLGQQPTGQFPKGWDIGLVSACVGERRQIKVPPVLAYGEKGLKKRGIPPNSILIYDIIVKSINGNALPR